MIKPNINLSKRQRVLLVITVACLCVAGLLTLVSGAFAKTQTTQFCADAWDEDGRYSMVSVFLGKGNGLKADTIARFEYALDNALVTEAIEAPSDNARLYVAAYSFKTEVSLNTSKSGYQTCTAYGVEGDFFRFHPFELISGCYLMEDSVMKDYVVIDEDAAWKLFGAIEVDGMPLTYNGTQYTVMGVVKTEDGYKSKQGGAEGGIIYFPLNTFSDAEATCVEMIFPNPVSGFATDKISSAMKDCGNSDDTMVIVENSRRYNFATSVKRAVSWTKRGMSFKEISYPYWENSAIAVENIVDLFTILRVLFFIPPALIIIVSVIRFHPFHRLKILVFKIADKLRK